jgi:HEAT repeat protein
MKNQMIGVGCVVAMVAAWPASPGHAAAPSSQEPQDKQSKLIAVLTSGAAPEEKALACKKLAVYGGKEAVPALAPLLADERLASWARIALEAIPSPAADSALRDAAEKLHGKLLVGVVNSLGVRRDAKATSLLTRQLKEQDAEVASAAAIALGRIGSAKAASALTRSLAEPRADVRSAIAQGCILCAEQRLAEMDYADATKLYDTVRTAAVPRQRLLEATRGAILARQSGGLPLLLEHLRSPDKGFFYIALRTARELPGAEITGALATELERTSPDRQPQLLLALSDRTDGLVVPVLLQATGKGPLKVRLVAVGALERRGTSACVPALLKAAAAPEPELAQAALGVLARLPGASVDTNILGRLQQSQSKQRQVLIQLATQRRLDAALPAMLSSAQDADAGVRSAAFEGIGALGDEKQAGELVRLLPNISNPADRSNIESALISLASRKPAGCLLPLLRLAQSENSSLRIIGLHALASAGGPEALASIVEATKDQEEPVQDEAVRVLSTWPNNWPDDASVARPLLQLAKSSEKTTYQTLGLRGYLQYVQVNKKLDNAAKVTKVSQVVPLMKRPEEKRLAITALHGIQTPGALELLLSFASDSALVEDACSALVSLAGHRSGGSLSAAERKQALQTVINKSQNEATKTRAQEALKGVQTGEPVGQAL